MKQIALETLREMLSYDAATGEFHWLIQKGTVKAGARAGFMSDRGYVLISINGRKYRAHRLAWLYVTGAWPLNEIDHRDGNRANNRFANLRDIPGTGNRQNTKRQANNTSGFTGVVWDRSVGRWRARIRVNNRYRYLGVFKNKLDAHRAYLAGKRRFHPFQPVPRSEVAG